ncbi:hypothetical protein ACFZ9I_32125, partial [Pseudomonas aeruginosa]
AREILCKGLEMVSTKNRWTPCREQEGSGRCVGQTLTEKRPLHAAQLWERWGTSARRGLLPPLFDVQVLRITPRGLLLRGFQVDTSNRPNTAQHAQEWWAVPIEKPGAA